MRALLAAAIATSVFLFLSLIVGINQTANNYLVYGPSYVETIVINGVETSTVVTWQSSAFSMLLILWLVILILLMARDIYRSGRFKGGLTD